MDNCLCLLRHTTVLDNHEPTSEVEFLDAMSDALNIIGSGKLEVASLNELISADDARSDKLTSTLDTIERLIVNARMHGFR